tara:strand:- start:2669 stop:2884 length:216 start_codon:yes stop_codon:yes gene_type:complete
MSKERDDTLIRKAISQFENLIESKKNLDIALAINKSNLENMEWKDDFINYIQKNYSNKYNEACEYIDKINK